MVRPIAPLLLIQYQTHQLCCAYIKLEFGGQVSRYQCVRYVQPLKAMAQLRAVAKFIRASKVGQSVLLLIYYL